MAEVEEMQEQEKIELEEKVIQIDRVTRVVKGGRRLRFRATVVVGDKNGNVGIACEKAGDVTAAMTKSIARAKKDMVKVTLNETTIPHQVTAEFAGAKIFLKPARKGTGVIAGGAVRAVLEAAGIKDILSKIYGSSSKLNNVYATMKALSSLKVVEKNGQKDKKEAKDSKKIKGKASEEIDKNITGKKQKPEKAESKKDNTKKKSGS